MLPTLRDAEKAVFDFSCSVESIPYEMIKEAALFMTRKYNYKHSIDEYEVMNEMESLLEKYPYNKDKSSLKTYVHSIAEYAVMNCIKASLNAMPLEETYYRGDCEEISIIRRLEEFPVDELEAFINSMDTFNKTNKCVCLKNESLKETLVILLSKMSLDAIILEVKDVIKSKKHVACRVS